MLEAPTLEEIRTSRAALGEAVARTPVHHWRAPPLTRLLGDETEIFLKLELFQVGGSFKARGATLAIRALSAEARKRGVVTASGGNHAIAVALAAKATGTPARVYMPAHANPFRQRRCREFGAQVELAASVHEAFKAAQHAAETEGLAYIHPFEGKPIVLGTATVGLEFLEQSSDLDAVVVPIGGGGLCAGIATAVKQLRPSCAVYGVEPEGADTMHRSFIAGSPQAIAEVKTIADSLGSPTALPYSFGLCRRFVDDVVLVSDDQMRWSMKLLFEEMKLAVEPAPAAAVAALLGPLREKLRGRRVGLIMCGTNIDTETHAGHISNAPPGAEPPPNSRQ